VIDWLKPLGPSDLQGKRIIELGCGNGSLLVHIADFNPETIVGVDLGTAVQAARRNLVESARCSWAIEQADLCEWKGEPGEVVLCIGVLHHLMNPQDGFKAVLRATQPGGRFHFWVSPLRITQRSGLLR
jgi:2-polyprenyl-3-methyl-5-hydroxy-6-metoxy-1,4-benzoquinol methylase